MEIINKLIWGLTLITDETNLIKAVTQPHLKLTLGEM